MKTLHLTIKKKFFDMIVSGEKKEEYREIKPYWAKRLAGVWTWIGYRLGLFPSLTTFMADFRIESFKPFTHVKLRNGYRPDSPTILVECKGIDIGEAVPEWSDNWKGNVFRIKLGNIIEKK